MGALDAENSPDSSARENPRFPRLSPRHEARHQVPGTPLVSIGSYTRTVKDIESTKFCVSLPVGQLVLPKRGPVVHSVFVVFRSLRSGFIHPEVHEYRLTPSTFTLRVSTARTTDRASGKFASNCSRLRAEQSFYRCVWRGIRCFVAERL